MKCAICNQHFDTEQQSPACPHPLILVPPPLPGGVRLREDFRSQIEDAYQLRNTQDLRRWLAHSSFAARAYARHLLDRLEEQEKNENEISISELQEQGD